MSGKIIPADGDGERVEARLAAVPTDYFAWLELARLRNAARQPSEAFIAANNALTLRPPSLEALYERGLAQLELGCASEAAAAFTTILAIQPLHTGVLISLGSAYYHLRRFREAGMIWEHALRVAPDQVGILEDLAVCYQRLGDFGKVAETWERALAHDASHPQALHHLAALGRRPPPDRASAAYIVKLFDEFAPDFDATLSSLGYDGPRLLADIVANHTPGSLGGWRILDLGCGTGLCAAHFRSRAGWLEGVDLSPGMLEKAKARNLYDELHCEEVVRFCDRSRGKFDLIVASDTLNYFGDLEQVMESMKGSLRSGGRCAFFVERMEDGSMENFRLERHGRFSHRPGYVEDCLAVAGLRLLARSAAPVRSEAGGPVLAEHFLVGFNLDESCDCSLPGKPAA